MYIFSSRCEMGRGPATCVAIPVSLIVDIAVVEKYHKYDGLWTPPVFEWFDLEEVLVRMQRSTRAETDEITKHRTEMGVLNSNAWSVMVDSGGAESTACVVWLSDWIGLDLMHGFRVCPLPVWG